MDWLRAASPDVVCIQEIKAHPEQLDLSLFEKAGYLHYWFPAQKKGYSGVAVLARKQPDSVEYGMGIDKYDAEGRTLRVDFGDLSVMSAYFPSGTTGDIRQQFKYEFLDDFLSYMCELRKNRPNIIVSGDYNICHKPIDIHDPVRNANSSGFLPEERAWMSKFIESGFVDTFRHFNPEPHHYSWWSYRANARARNLGWRIDYHMCTDSLKSKLQRAEILPGARHSDHCPVLLEINLN